ncbi:MAG: DUF4123 domain-containing protein [Blastocatellia bacterium]
MNDQQIRQHLFSDTTRLYCVLDGVLVPQLPKRLYESQLPNVCLLAGDLTPDMVYAAPYLVMLTPDSKFADWVFAESLGRHWGIFAQSPQSLIEMRKHFTALLSAYDERGNPMMFRYYDPRVFRNFIPTCNGGELATLFGKVESFFTETETGDGLTKYRIANNELATTDLN